MLQKLSTRRVSRKISRLYAKILKIVSNEGTDSLEYGNARKGDEWAKLKDGKYVWSLEIDLLSQRPMIYTIEYDPTMGRYTCFSRMGIKSDMKSLLQFSTENFDELSEKLQELASNIPGLRERMIREYIFHQGDLQPRRRWLKFWKASKNKEEYLLTVVETLREQQKISTGEAQRVSEYVRVFTGKV